MDVRWTIQEVYDDCKTRKDEEDNVLKNAASMALELRTLKILLEDIVYAGHLCARHPYLFEIPCKELNRPWKPLEDQAQDIKPLMFDFDKKIAKIRGEDWCYYTIDKRFHDPSLRTLMQLRMWSTPYAYSGYELDPNAASYVKKAIEENPDIISGAVAKIPNISPKGKTALEAYCKDMQFKTESEWGVSAYIGEKGLVPELQR